MKPSRRGATRAAGEEILLFSSRRGGLSDMREHLTRRGNAVSHFCAADAVLDRARARNAAVAFVDLSQGEEGSDLIRALRDLPDPPQAVAVVTPRGLAAALAAVRGGACDYMMLPADPAEVDYVLEKALQRRRVERRARAAGEMLARQGAFPDLVGQSAATRAIRAFIDKASRAALPILLLGETGTGKDLVARLIHRRGPRRAFPFVAVNCAGFTADLHTAQLFGYEKGSFTGAVERRRGVFETADGGTLFLDEINALHPAAQAGLLRVIENGELRRVGAAAAIRVDVRVIVAASGDLARAVQKGTFRKDLFFRVNGLTFRVPSLRERARDVPALARYFLEKIRGARATPVFAPEALKALAAHAWPGNVRELRNLVERLALTAGGEVIGAGDVRALLAAAPLAAPEEPPEETLRAVEKAHIRRILERYAGNKTHAARALGISLRNLYQKIDLYGLRRFAGELRRSARGAAS